MSDHDTNTEFWMSLLKRATNDPIPHKFWNYFIKVNFGGRKVDHLMAEGQRDGFWQRMEVGQPDIHYESAVKDAAEFGRMPYLQPSKPPQSFMNFSGRKFPKEFLLERFIVIGADFSDAVFNGCADFSKTVFLGVTNFQGAKFEGCSPKVQGGSGTVSFESSKFHDTVSFENVWFPRTTRLNNATFFGSLNYRKATFDWRPGDSDNSELTFNGPQSRTEAESFGTKFAYLESEGRIQEAQAGQGTVFFESSKFHDTVDFDNVRFPHTARFDNATFDGPLHCRNATFDWISGDSENRKMKYSGLQSRTKPVLYDTKSALAKSEERAPEAQAGHGMVSFESSKFHDAVNLDNVRFPHTTRFDNATFDGPLNCRKATFGCGFDGSENGAVVFSGSTFISEVDFCKTEFEVATKFERTKFKGNVGFKESHFRTKVSFNDSNFLNAISFRKASFKIPPNFFKTDLYDDADFGRVDWSGAERSYHRRSRQGEKLDLVEERADDAVRVWSRLALIMSKQEKSAERHEFFRLKMRAQRQRDGLSLLSVANLLFDGLSDYGWGVGRALFWWTVHVVVGAISLAGTAWCRSGDADHGSALTIVLNGLFVSIGNSLAFLQLVSEGGYLYDARVFIDDATSGVGFPIVDLVGTIQAVLGPILLFLVLLTLRNRFKLV